MFASFCQILISVKTTETSTVIQVGKTGANRVVNVNTDI